MAGERILLLGAVAVFYLKGRPKCLESKVRLIKGEAKFLSGSGHPKVCLEVKKFVI